MCTHSVKLRTRALYINPNNYIGGYEVPCGKCSIDRTARTIGYKLRLYYEALGVQKDGGCTIFDTLTYKPEDLPMYRGVPCFKHEDIVNFRKLLRTRLERAGFAPYLGTYGTDTYKDLLKTFIVSEYGGTTSRPHYHIMVFNHNPNLSAQCLHGFIHECWTHGFTDLKLKVVDINKKGIGAIHYTAKYMTKSEEEEKDLTETLQKCCKDKSPEEITEIVNERRGHFALRCWSSKGLGDYAFEWLKEHPNFERIFLQHGQLPIPNAKNQIQLLRVPHFYIYRKFYTRTMNEKTNRKDYFVLNRLGQDWKEADIERRIDKLGQQIGEAIGFAEVENLGKLRAIGFNSFDSTMRHDLAVYALVFDGRRLYDADFDRWREIYRDGLDPDSHSARNPYAWDPDDEQSITVFKRRDEEMRVEYSDPYLHFLSVCWAITSEAIKAKQKEAEDKQAEKLKCYNRLKSLKAATNAKRVLSFAELLTLKNQK